MKKIILLDGSSFFYRFAMSYNGAHGPNVDFTEHVDPMLGYIHASFNKLKKQHSAQFIVFADENRTNFRKNLFKEYKAARKVDRAENSKFDFDSFFAAKQEWIEHIQNKTDAVYMSVDYAEADDILYVLAKQYPNNSIICSPDKDLKQAGVPQYKLCGKVVDDESYDIRLHCIVGDEADGIPPANQKDSFFVDGNSLKGTLPRKTKKWRASQLAMKESQLIETYPYYERNRKLIDMSMIPESIRENILFCAQEYLEPKLNESVEQRWLRLFSTE